MTVQKKMRGPQKRSTFNSQKAGLSDDKVAELWKKYSQPTPSNLATIAGMPKLHLNQRPRPRQSKVQFLQNQENLTFNNMEFSLKN